MEQQAVLGADCEIEEWRIVWEEVRIAADNAADKAACSWDVEARDLKTQLMLHLPRFATRALHADDIITDEALRLAGIRSHAIGPYGSWFQGERAGPLRRCDAVLSNVAADVMHIILERFHYVHSYREGVHFGLQFSNIPFPPAAVLTLSPLDVGHLEALLPPGSMPTSALVLSRLFAFDWAPRNAITCLLGLVRRWLVRHQPNIGTLFTYINPNLEFNAASWRAGNWQRIGKKDIQYRYLGGNYLSAREYQVLAPDTRRSVAFSQYRLKPLDIWSLAVKHPHNGKVTIP